MNNGTREEWKETKKVEKIISLNMIKKQFSEPNVRLADIET